MPPGHDEIQQREQRPPRGRRQVERPEAVEHDTGDGHDDAGRQHLHDGADERVGGLCQPPAVERARAPEQGGHDGPDQPWGLGARAAGGEQHDHADDAQRGARDRSAPDALPRQRPVADDPERGGGRQHGRQVGGRVRLGDRHDADASDQQPDARERRAAHLLRARPRAEPAERRQRAEREQPGEDEAHAAGSQRVERLDGDADGEVGRAPHDVEQSHRQEHLCPHPRTIATGRRRRADGRR